VSNQLEKKPHTSTEIFHEPLATALRAKVDVIKLPELTLKKEDLEKLNVPDLSHNSYIKVGDRFLKPADVAPIGSRWKVLDIEKKPPSSTEIFHEALACALRAKQEWTVTLTKQELDKLNVQHLLEHNCYIKVADRYLKPAEAAPSSGDGCLCNTHCNARCNTHCNTHCNMSSECHLYILQHTATSLTLQHTLQRTLQHTLPRTLQHTLQHVF